MKKEILNRLKNDSKVAFDNLSEEDDFYQMETEAPRRSRRKNKRSKPTHKKWDE